MTKQSIFPSFHPLYVASRLKLIAFFSNFIYQTPRLLLLRIVNCSIPILHERERERDKPFSYFSSRSSVSCIVMKTDHLSPVLYTWQQVNYDTFIKLHEPLYDVGKSKKWNVILHEIRMFLTFFQWRRTRGKRHPKLVKLARKFIYMQHLPVFWKCIFHSWKYCNN